MMQDLSDDPLLEGLTRDDQGRPVLGGIALAAVLGRGSHGKVYYGESPSLDGPVAVKAVQGRKNRDAARRFLIEALAMAQLSSPHLVQVLSAGHDQGMHYLVLEYVSGSTAGDYLDKELRVQGRGLVEDEALTLITATTRGAAAAHGRSIVHCDIKPENILIPYSMQGLEPLLAEAKLTDLGTAQLRASFEDQLGPRTPMGTLGVLSPEQLRMEGNIGPPSDVFSLGATLYLLLTGESPFEAVEDQEVARRTIQGIATPIENHRPDISAGTVAIIEKCLRDEPSERYWDGLDLLEALEGK